MSERSQSGRGLHTDLPHAIQPELQERLIKYSQKVVVVVLLGYIAFPLYWTVTAAFKAYSELFRTPPTLIPESLTLVHFQQLLTESQFPTYFINSSIVAIGATLLTTVLATLAGYGLTRASFRGKKMLARSVLLAYMFPPILLAIPYYSVFFNLGLLNSYVSLILAHSTIALPFSIWIMWQYFQTIPMSYEEAAWIDGAGRLRTVWQVVLPMARPGVVAIAIFAFALSWNDYTFAVVLMTDGGMFTIPIGVNGFIDQTTIRWGLVLSAGVLTMLPAFLLVAFLQKYLLQGFSVSGLD